MSKVKASRKVPSAPKADKHDKPQFDPVKRDEAIKLETSLMTDSATRWHRIASIVVDELERTKRNQTELGKFYGKSQGWVSQKCGLMTYCREHWGGKVPDKHEDRRLLCLMADSSATSALRKLENESGKSAGERTVRLWSEKLLAAVRAAGRSNVSILTLTKVLAWLMANSQASAEAVAKEATAIERTRKTAATTTSKGRKVRVA